MNDSIATDILDLSDEILLIIFNKLDYIDVRYSLRGVNKKFDKLTRDVTLSRSVNFSIASSNEENNSRFNLIFDRFHVNILSEIEHNIECITLEPSLIERFLYVGDYPRLHKITLVNLQLETASRILTNESLFIQKFKGNISHLSFTINDDIANGDKWKLVTNIFGRIFVLFPNLTHLEFDLEDTCAFSPGLTYYLPSTACYSSSIIYLRVEVYDFGDCLYLLDGRLNQLHTFIVNIMGMALPLFDHDETIENFNQNEKKVLSTLKCFALFSTSIRGYDTHIVPLLHRMSELEKLILSLTIKKRSSFVDGTHLNDDVLCHMPHLRTFTFDIVTKNVKMNKEHFPSPDDIRRTFIEREYHVDCYIDYCSNEGSRCHVYSLPFTLKFLHSISNNFPGGLFLTVRRLAIYDAVRPFEHDFFTRLTQFFPLLKILSIHNIIKQSNEREETSSIIRYPHLTNLTFGCVHIDYLEEFFIDSNISLPCLEKFYINHEDLVVITENFTRNATRAICSKVKHIIFDEGTLVLSKEFYLYFPLL